MRQTFHARLNLEAVYTYPRLIHVPKLVNYKGQLRLFGNEISNISMQLVVCREGGRDLNEYTNRRS